MRRVTYLWLTAGILAIFLVSFGAAQSESLGDYARQVRKQKGQKRAGKQFDDDVMPKSDTISVVGQPRGQAPADDSAKAKAKPASEDDADANDASKSAAKPETQPKSDAATKSDPQAAKNDEAAQRDKANKDWQKKLEEQKSQIDMLSRELDVMQREYRLRAAAMYADAGNRLRNSAQWDKEDADYKQKVAAKQKAIDDAKQQLEDMKEEARKAGVPAPYRE